MTYEAAYTNGPGSADNEINLLVGWLDVPTSKIVVVTPQMQNAKASPMVGRLIAGGAELITLRSGGSTRQPNILALWLSDKELATVERFPNVDRLALAGWAPPEFDIWRYSRSAVEISGANPTDRNELNPVVRAAMLDMAGLAGSGNGFTGYSRDYAIDALQKLRRSGYSWCPTECAIAYAEGGAPLDAAAELRELAADIAAGKTRRMSSRTGSGLRDDIVGVWQDQVGEVTTFGPTASVPEPRLVSSARSAGVARANLFR